MRRRTLAFCILSLFQLLVSLPSQAQETKTVVQGQFSWTFDPSRTQVVESLADLAPRARTQICSLLPSCGTLVILVRVAETEAEFLAVQPERVHVDWASGVAWPEQNLIVLRVDQTMILSLEETFEHELSHLLLYQAVKVDIPRWFVEGLAILQSERNMIQRFEAVAGATVSDSLYTLDQLSGGFPATISGRGLAYAQSGMFVSWLYRVLGKAAFRDVLVAMANGMPVDEAIRRVHGVTLSSMEEVWKESLGSGAWLKGLTDSWLLWTILGLLVVVGVVVRRRRNARRIGMGSDDGPDWEFRN